MKPPQLKTDPVYGVFLWWPDDGNTWIHPEDRAAAETLLPSDRVFRRDGLEDTYVVAHYGETKIRVERRLWLVVPSDGMDIGDQVEVKSRGAKNTYRVGVVREMRWHKPSRSIRYQIADGDQLLPNTYTADDLRRLDDHETVI